MDQFPEKYSSSHNNDLFIENTTNLSTTLDIYNSTQTPWTADENLELVTAFDKIIDQFELPLGLYFAVRLLMGGLAIFANILTICVVAKFERLQTCTNYLICNLAANDMMAGVLVPLMMIHELFPNSSFFIPICLFEKTLSLMITGGNFASILYLSGDRYIFIAHGLRYHDLVTPTRIILLLSFTWTFASLTIPFMVSFANHLQVGVTCTYFIFLDAWVIEYYLFPLMVYHVLMTIGFHLAIAKIAHRQARAITAQQLPYDTMEVAISQNTKKISRTLGMVLGFYLLSIMPQTITISAIQKNKSLLPLQRFTNLLYWTNSWVNPLIYAWRLKDFKIAFRKLLTGTGSFNEVPPHNVAVIEMN